MSGLRRRMMQKKNRKGSRPNTSDAGQELSEVPKLNLNLMETDSDSDYEVGEPSNSQNKPEESKKKPKKQVYLPGKPLDEDEELVCDESAYIMLHQAFAGAPCLSFDVIDDELGDDREEFPLTSYIVAGTQAARIHVNKLIVMKMHNLHRTNKERTSDDDDEEESSEDDSEDEDEDKLRKPKMTAASIKHPGCINRVKQQKIGNSVFAASWSELGIVYIWKLDDQLQAIEDPNLLKEYEKNMADYKHVYSFNGHLTEGFAIDWSPCAPGVLATGDCNRDIHIWKPMEDGSWNVDQRSLVGHSRSVEDIQWSPNEPNVLATCSVDESIRIWDVRASPEKACMLTCENAHTSDVNVISWNKNEPFIVSGGDDGVLHVWDLRQFQSKKPIASFKHHTEPVITVEWCPKDSTVFASGAADDQVAIWDLALEKDAASVDEELKDLPPQLLFIHQGQQDIKEVHWHPKLPGVIISTAGDGFNIFRTISV